MCAHCVQLLIELVALCTRMTLYVCMYLSVSERDGERGRERERELGRGRDGGRGIERAREGERGGGREREDNTTHSYTWTPLQVQKRLFEAGLMVDADLAPGDTFNKKIRNAQLAQYNYILGKFIFKNHYNSVYSTVSHHLSSKIVSYKDKITNKNYDSA